MGQNLGLCMKEEHPCWACSELQRPMHNGHVGVWGRRPQLPRSVMEVRAGSCGSEEVLSDACLT